MYQEPKHIVSSYNANDIGRTLYDIVRTEQPKIVVEFGILYGYSTVCMAQAVRDNGFGKILAYDMFDDYPYNHGERDIAIHNLEYYNLNSVVDVNELDFYEWLENPCEFDLLHFDISNDGGTLKHVESKLWSQIANGATILFEGGSFDRDHINWMQKYNKERMHPLRNSIPYEILRIEYPSLSKFKKRNG